MVAREAGVFPGVAVAGDFNDAGLHSVAIYIMMITLGHAGEILKVLAHALFGTRRARRA